MKRPLNTLLCLVAALGLSVCAVPAHAGWWDDAARARETSVDQLAQERRDGSIAEHLPQLVTAQVIVTRRPGEKVSGQAVLHAKGARQALQVRVRPGTAAARALNRLDEDAEYQVHLVARNDGGTRVLEALRFTAPDGPLTPEERGDLRRARRFHEAGNSRTASHLLEALLARRAHSRVNRLALLTDLGAALTAQRRLREAMHAYHRVLQLDPRNRDARVAILRLSEKPPERKPTAATEPVAPPTSGNGATRPPKGPAGDLTAPPLPPAPGLAPAGGFPAPPVKKPTTTPPKTSDGKSSVPPKPADPKKDGTEEEPPPPPPPNLSGPR